MKIKIFVVLVMMINQFIVGEVQKLKIFLHLIKYIKNCKVFKLEQNYRSTKNILETASNLISNNSNRVGKKLWSSADQGELVKLNCYRTGKDEAQGISDIIEQKIKKNILLNDVSILVRAIYQTREFEERFFNWYWLSCFRWHKVL